MTAADSTVPHWAKYSLSVSLVVEYDNPPTYSFEAIRISFNRSSALMHAPILGRANIGGEGAGCGATSPVYTIWPGPQRGAGYRSITGWARRPRPGRDRPQGEPRGFAEADRARPLS